MKRNQSDSDEEPIIVSKPNPYLVSQFHQFASVNLNTYVEANGGMPCCSKTSSTKQPSLASQHMNEASIMATFRRHRKSSSGVAADEAASNNENNNNNYNTTSMEVETATRLSMTEQAANLRPNNQTELQSVSTATTTTTVESLSPKQFFYHVDPMLLDCFISVFNMLKRKSLNKDFQF